MEHISPQSLMTRSTVSPDPMFAMDDYLCVPASSLSVTKPVKKRKSWGQELPEPKTALPPRKRAKTEDEKEQRRIERIKRNRAAAHNSRERKRIEAEHLATANDALHKQLQSLRQRVSEQDLLLDKCREMLGGTLPEVSTEHTKDLPYKPSQPSSLRRSVSASPSASSTIDPRDALSIGTPATSVENTPYIKMEDSMPGLMENDMALFGSLDLTQHSAAMLCDLQCQSTAPFNNSPLSPRSTLPTWFWTAIFLSTMQASIMNLYRTSLLAMWTISPAQMRRLSATLAPGSTLKAQPRPLTSRSPTPPPNWVTLAQHFLLATGPSTPASSALALSAVRSESSLRSLGWSSRRSAGHGSDDGGFFGDKGDTGIDDRPWMGLGKHGHDKKNGA